MARIYFERKHPAVFRKRAAEPDRAIAAECADFQNPPGADRLREHEQQPPEDGRNADLRYLSRLHICDRRRKRFILLREQAFDIAVDSGKDVGHRKLLAL